MAAERLKSFDDAAKVLESLRADAPALATIARVADALAACFKSGRKALICGNGGSMCDAMHFAEELTGRFREDRRPLPAIACADPGHITCTANDYGFEEVFSRWVAALGGSGDVLIVLSTSGESENIVRAVRVAKANGLITVALLGKGGGRLKTTCTHEIIVAGDTSDRIQELHMLILHAWVEEVEKRLFSR